MLEERERGKERKREGDREGERESEGARERERGSYHPFRDQSLCVCFMCLCMGHSRLLCFSSPDSNVSQHRLLCPGLKGQITTCTLFVFILIRVVVQPVRSGLSVSCCVWGCKRDVNPNKLSFK